MPELLIVTRVFPPKGGGGVQRMLKFAVYLADHGWNCTVVAPEIGKQVSWHDDSQLGLFDPDRVIRIGCETQNRSLPTRIARRLYPVDAHYPWAGQVARELKNQTSLRPDAVLSSGPPHSVHRAAELIARQRRIPWVADFRDHYTLNPEYRPTSFLHRAIDRRFEKRILDRSTAVVCNTRTNRRELLKEFGLQYANKTSTIYNGFDLNDLAETDQPNELTQNFDPQQLNLVYMGGLRGGEVDDSFFRMIETATSDPNHSVRPFVIHIIGDTSRRTALCDQLVTQGTVRLYDAVPPNAMSGVLSRADACLTWQRDRTRYRGTIAGKVFDYLAMKKPVFSLGQIGGEVDRLISRFGLGVSVSPSSTDQSAQAFVAFLQQLGDGHYQLRESSRCQLMRFSRQHQAGQLAQLLNQITGSR